MSIAIDGTLSVSVSWTPTMQLRCVVPEQTYAGEPKLQQLWLEQFSGATQWRTVPREVLSNAEFFGA